LASAAKKRYEGDPDVVVAINRRTGHYETFRRWQIVADGAPFENVDREMAHTEARKLQADAQVGGYVQIPLENADFGGRIAPISAAGSPLRPPSRSSSRKCATPSARRSWKLICTERET